VEEGRSLHALGEAARFMLGASQELVINAHVGATGKKTIEGEGGCRWDVSIGRFGAGPICARAAYVHVESDLPATEDNCIKAALSVLPEGAISLNQSKSGGQGLRGSGSGYVYMATCPVCWSSSRLHSLTTHHGTLHFPRAFPPHASRSKFSITTALANGRVRALFFVLFFCFATK